MKPIIALIAALLIVPIVYANTDFAVWQGQYYIGTNFKTGSYTFNFTVYNNLTAGNSCYTNTSTITTGNWGEWKFEPINIAAACNDSNTDYYVNIKIDGIDQTPRRRLTLFNYLRKNVNETTTATLDAAKLKANVFAYNTSIGAPTTLVNGECYYTNIATDVQYNCVMDADSDVVLQVGEELYLDTPAKNIDSTDIANCEPVYVTGSSGNKLTIKKSSAASYRVAQSTVGLATQPIAVNGAGRVTKAGSVGDCNTSAWAEGTPLYLSNTAGVLTSTPPTGNTTKYFVGIVTHQDGTDGRISVMPLFNPSPQDLTYVNWTNLNNAILVYNNVTALWDTKNVSTIVQNAPLNNLTFTGNYSPIIFSGAGTVWDDLRMPFSAANKPVSDPADCLATFRNSTVACSFASGALNQVYATIQMPHGYKLGSDIECHLHWAPSTNGTGNVTWYMEVVKADIGGIFGNSTTYTCSQAGGGTPYKHNLCDFHSIGNFTGISGIANFRFYRTSGDTYAAAAFGLSADCHYEIDSLGSNDEYSKW